MSKQFYFMFSSGQYSDYGVGGVYICDHEVTEGEWHAHYLKYQESLRNRYERLGGAIYDEPNWTRQKNWEKRNDPETTFQKLHRMKKLEVTELWRDA